MRAVIQYVRAKQLLLSLDLQLRRLHRELVVKEQCIASLQSTNRLHRQQLQQLARAAAEVGLQVTPPHLLHVADADARNSSPAALHNTSALAAPVLTRCTWPLQQQSNSAAPRQPRKPTRCSNQGKGFGSSADTAASRACSTSAGGPERLQGMMEFGSSSGSSHTGN